MREKLTALLGLKTLCVLLLLFCGKGFAQENTAITLDKDSLWVILKAYSFSGYHTYPNFPDQFSMKKSKTFGIPADETILAFVDASILENFKYGVAFGLKGLYICNANTSASTGTRFISYLELKTHKLVRTDPFEFAVGFTAIELRGLEDFEQNDFEDILKKIKYKLL